MTEHDTEYTKHRIQVQRGDGPDRRGKVETEIVRERHDKTGKPVDVELPNGETVTVTPHSEAFGELVLESERAVAVLEERLGLDQPE